MTEENFKGDRWFNEVTGEFKDDVRSITTGSDIKKREENIKAFHLRREFFNTIGKELGNFYFYRYDKLLELLNEDTATAFRFLYLCTYGDKHGNILTYNDQKCSTYSDFIFIFDRTKSSVIKIVKTLEDYKLIYKQNDYYKISREYYSMNLDSTAFKKNSIRTFNRAIRDLYNNSDPREHSIIGELLKLVPYINISNNVLCWNIEDVHPDEIVPLDMNEIRTILRPKSDYGRKIMNKLEKLFVKGEPVLGKFNSVDQIQYVINPRLFYRGNDITQLNAIIEQFDISKHRYLNNKNKKRMIKEN